MKQFKYFITEGRRSETKLLVDEIYSRYIDEHDTNSVECVGWMDGIENSLIRFQKIYEGGIGDDDSILDVGCGVAHLHTYLKNQGWNGKYLGIDPNKKAIDLIDENINTMCGTIEDLDELRRRTGRGWFEWNKFDWVVASGVFNLGLTVNLIFSIIHNMISHANKGIVFNMLKYPYSSIPLEGHESINYESYQPNYVKNKLLEYENDRIEIARNYMTDDTEFTVYFYKENE